MPTIAVDPGGPTATQPRMRSSQSLTHEHVPTHEELAKLNQDVLASTTQAREFLKKQGYAPADVQGN